MKLKRRTLLSAGLAGLAWTATQGLAAASNRTRFVFHVSSTWGDLFDWLVDRGYAPITAELEKRSFPSMLVHSSVRGSDTPNEDRASAVVKALQNVTDDVVIVGISNQGNFLPLVAAARPIRRVVYVNALIPRPGKAFIEVCQTEQVAVPGSYLDKLLTASQSITDDSEAHSQSQCDEGAAQSNAGTHRRLVIRSYHGRLLRSLSAESAAEGRQRVRFGIG